MFTVPSCEEFEALKKVVDALQGRVAQLETIPVPDEKLCQSQANKLFMGRTGKPLDRETFDKMVVEWIENDFLKENVNYWKGNGTRYISLNFLMGRQEDYNKSKLKIA